METQHRKAIGRIALMVVIFLALVPANASAIRLGSSYKNDYAKVSPGDSVQFTIIVWTPDKEPFEVRFAETDAPEGWTVLASPKNISLSKDPGPPIEYINLPNEGSIKASPVNIFVKTPPDAQNGLHEIRIKALAFGSSIGEIAVRQERRFLFTVEIVNGEPAIEPPANSSSVFEGIIGAITSIKETIGPGQASPVALLVIALILVFSVLIYKHGQ